MIFDNAMMMMMMVMATVMTRSVAIQTGAKIMTKQESKILAVPPRVSAPSPTRGWAVAMGPSVAGRGARVAGRDVRTGNERERVGRESESVFFFFFLFFSLNDYSATEKCN